MWMKDHNIRGFYLANQSATFEEGAKNCITMAGLGKLSPNLLLVGFSSKWRQNISMNIEYVNTLFCAFEQRLSVTILRVKDGFDYSSKIKSFLNHYEFQIKPRLIGTSKSVFSITLSKNKKVSTYMFEKQKVF